MSQVPPPPAAGPPAAGPPAPAGARPPLATAAAVVLFIAGGLGVVAGLLLLSVGGIFTAIGLLSAVIGAAEIYAGVQILAGREQGRILGLILAGIGALFAIISIGQSAPTSILNLLLNGFVIYALVTTAAWFKR